MTMLRDWVLVLALGGLTLAGCGDGDGPGEEDCASAAGGCGGPSGSESFLGADAETYVEANEMANANTAMAESTGYVLESVGGLAVEGSFEPTSPGADSFLFNSGALGTLGEPGFPGVDIQVVIDGAALDTGEGVSLSLDTVQEFGYSSLSGSYFMNAALLRGKDYVLRVTPGVALAGKDYTIEIRGHSAER
jgi:hypothetical protein